VSGEGADFEAIVKVQRIEIDELRRENSRLRRKLRDANDLAYSLFFATREKERDE